MQNIATFETAHSLPIQQCAQLANHPGAALPSSDLDLLALVLVGASWDWEWEACMLMQQQQQQRENQ